MEPFKCETCGLRSDATCMLTNLQVDSNKDFCSHHTFNLQKCAICGNGILSRAIISNGKIYCAKCAKFIDTCITCTMQAICTFETDPSPLPKMIMKQVRNGNMIMQAPIRNPEREKITCYNCPCYDAMHHNCNKSEENYNCEKYKENI